MITTVAETTSTNEDMLALAKAGAAEGCWIRAETQTAGRGRMGRGWQSPVGNLYASTLVRLLPGDPSAATLALVAAVALAETLQAHAPGHRVSIKWPNDLLIGDAKISGILLERTDDAVVIGFGVNLIFHPVGLDRTVTSVAALGLDAPDAGHFCEDLAVAFARWRGQWRQNFTSVRTAWEHAAHPRGTALRANLSDSSHVDGLFHGLDADGALRLRLADGSVRAIHAGDVFLL